jgi:hypothetical protein
VRRRLAALLPALVLAGCATALPRPPAQLQVLATRNGETWTADFQFPSRARAWVFVRSALARVGEQPWRPRSWTVETPGVRLERRGHYDVLVAGNGGRVPAQVRVRIAPFTGDLIADYDPALVLTDGSVALYSGQFEAFPLDSAAAAAQLPIDLSGSGAPASPTRVTFRDSAGQLLHSGQRLDTVSLDQASATYVLAGPAEPIVTDAVSTIIDPELPRWIAQSMAASAAEILARYAAEMGPVAGPKPTILVSWAGPTPRIRSMGGSTLPGLIAITYEGAGVLRENAELRAYGRKFIAHEAAHFWLGETIRYQYSRDAWITEGGADLLAIRTVAALDPGYDWRAELNLSIADCASLSAGRGVASAEQRNEHRAYYACGALFGLLAEGASGRPFTHFVKGLIAANRADTVVTREEWLAALDQVSGDRALSDGIAALLDRGAADPEAAIAALLARAGVAHYVGGDGMPRLR